MKRLKDKLIEFAEKDHSSVEKLSEAFAELVPSFLCRLFQHLMLAFFFPCSKHQLGVFSSSFVSSASHADFIKICTGINGIVA